MRSIHTLFLRKIVPDRYSVKPFVLLCIFILFCAIQQLRAGDYYWVGGSGNWSDHANHWATTSGGLVFHVTLPSPFDNVFFDANSFPSFGDTVYIDTPIITCNNMNWNGVTNNPTLVSSVTPATLKVYGSLTLATAMTWNFNSWPHYISFESTAPGNTITTAGQQLADIEFNGIGGSWELLDALNTSYITHNNGTFSTNGYPIYCTGQIRSQSGNTRGLYLDTSFINSGSYWAINATGLTMDADSTFIFTSGFSGGTGQVYYDVTCTNWNFSSSNSTFNTVIFPNYGRMSGSNNTFNSILFQGDGVITGNNNTFYKAEFQVLAEIYGNNTFDTLFFNNPGNTVILGAGNTQTITGELLANGNCSALISIESSTLGTQATFSKSIGNVTVNYLLMQDINATGGAIFTANNSTVISNVSGWIVNTPNPQDLYWVGGSGNWNDASHWDTISGGSGGSCIPTPFDNVFFDDSSFTGGGQTLTLNVSNVYCNNMDWSDVTNNPNIIGSGGTTFEIYGSLTLVAGMTWNFLGWNDLISFQSTNPGNTITTAGQQLSDIEFEGIGGGWDLLDALNTSYITHNNGTFSTNGYPIYCMGQIRSQSSNTRGLYLDTSFINSGSYWAINATGLTMDADSTFIFTSGFSGGTGQAYYDVTCTNWDFFSSNSTFNMVTFQNYGRMNGSNNTFNSILFQGNGVITGNNNTFYKAEFQVLAEIYGNNTFDTLFFNNPGNTVILGAGNTQTITGELLANGLSGFPIDFESSSLNTQTTIFKTTDTVCLNYIFMKDMNATGGALFYAGDNSVDISNNTGWIFASCTPPMSNVWPGDVNYDLIVDNVDILYLGIAYGETGTTRPGATINYTAQPALDWTSQFQNQVNTKHADCDGNGIVNLDDTLAVSLNYGQTHPAKQQNNQNLTSQAGPDLYFEFPGDSIASGASISVPVKLGTMTIPADSIYGIAFTVNYNPAMIKPSAVNVDYSNSWMVSDSNIIHLEKDFYSLGELDLGFSRIDHLNVSGNGTIVTLIFTMDSNVTGSFSLSFNDILLISHNETVIPVNPVSDSITVIDTTLTTAKNDINPENQVTIYPNPFSVTSTITFNNNPQSSYDFTLTDFIGKTVRIVNNISENKIIIKKEGLLPGLYFYHLTGDNGDYFIGKIIIE